MGILSIMGFRLSAGGFLIVIGNLLTILFLISPQGIANPVDTEYNNIVEESDRLYLPIIDHVSATETESSIE